MHSPVWQDYETAYDSTEDISDWEYYSDDYYDHEPPRKRRKANGGGDNWRTNSEGEKDAGKLHVAGGRRGLKPTEQIPALSLEDPANGSADAQACAEGSILWRSGFHSYDVSPPIAIDGQGEKVALLKDWRDRSKGFPVPVSSLGYPHRVKRKGSTQTMIAVVIDQQYKDDHYKVNEFSEKPPGQSLKASKQVHFAPSSNDTSDELTKPAKRLKSNSKTNGPTPSSIAKTIPSKNMKPSKRGHKDITNSSGVAPSTTNGPVTPSTANITSDQINKPSKRTPKQPFKANGTTTSKPNGSVAPSPADNTAETTQPSKRVPKLHAKANGTISSKAKVPSRFQAVNPNTDTKPKSTNPRKRKEPPSPEPHCSADEMGTLDVQSNGTIMVMRKRLKKTS